MVNVSRLRPSYLRLILVLIIGVIAVIVRFPDSFAQQPPTQPSQTVDFYRDVQPVLITNCAKCHQGPAAPAELRVDSIEGLMKGGTSGPAIVPGSADKSILMSRIADTGTNRMPPGGSLSANELAMIRAWINQGAHAEVPVDFTLQIEPILKSSCYSCHAGNEPQAKLHLDNRAMALEGGVSGPAIVPGNGKGSLLIHRVRGEDGKTQMPRVGTKLTPDQVALLEKWIDQGANRPDGTALHWAYVKPVRPPVPTVKNSSWVRNAIDSFVLARLEKEGLSPSPMASKETLARRLYLDLIGIPPSPAQTAAFVNDSRPDAYERLVDQLLASPHYGERMATPWLDLARYGDSNGYERDYQRVSWPYRDWVVRAFNENKPFDQFTVEQIAGDLLPNASTSQQTATGFVRSSMLNTEGGTDGDEQLWVAQVDRAITVGNVFLGSTIQCAQCHNHKYDPFTQKQFYQLVAFFDNIKQEIGSGGGPMDYRAVPERRLLLPTEEQAARCKQMDVEFAGLNSQLKADTPQIRDSETRWEQSLVQAEKEWQPLEPTRASSQSGSTLKIGPDKSILASGTNPDNDVYVIEAKSPTAGEITAIRIDALPDSTLPYNGPGRDEFGNFNVNKLSFAVGAGSSELTVKLATDLGTPTYDDGDDDDAAPRRGQNGWKSGLAEDQPRVPMMLVATPDKPIKLEADGTFRITLTQSAERSAGLGRFRILVTTSPNPKAALGIPYHLRPQLAMTRAERISYDAGLVGMMNESGGRAVKLSDSICGQPSFTTSKPPQNKNEQREDPVLAYWRTVTPEFESVRSKIATLKREVVNMKIASTLVLSENMDVAHPKTFIHERGMWTAKAEEVEADVPTFLGSIKDAPSNRLGLAKWLVSSDNPLTARVRVNQIWQTVFGMGIVETAEDFGTQGFRPSHPELLDWLATEFVSNGWDQKALLRLIVTSNTYRQSSNATPTLIEKDPRNVLLARGARYRVEAEMVRDIVLSVSGLLSEKMGGPPVMPPQPGGLWSFPVAAPNDNWVESKGEDKFRRALYVFVRRTVRYPSLLIFDAPSRETTISRRSPSNTPFQALTRLNDPAFFEAAQALAQRINTEGGADIASRLNYGFALVTSRTPNQREMDLLRKNYDQEHEYFSKNLNEAKDISGDSDAESAALIMVSNSLLNLNETITRE